MPAKNPRLTITLQPTLAAQLRRLSELTGNSQSALIAELLDGSTAVFDRLIRVLEAAELAKDSIRGSVGKDLDQAQTRIEGQLGLMLEDFDQGTAPLLDLAETIARRGRKTVSAAARDGGQAERRTPARAAARLGTPLSNRGVRSDPKKAKKPTATRT